jgi:hypothetical protein
MVAVAGAVVLAALTSCGSGGGDSAASPTSATATTAAADDPGRVAAELAGRYAHYDVVAYESADLKNLIISYGFTDLVEEDGQLMAEESFCHAEQRSDQPIETSISDAATSAIKPVPAPVTVTEVDGRLHLHRPPTPTGIGIHLDDPANEELPTDPADPRIADDDHDGAPGITVHVKVTDDFQGDLYIARREIFAYDLVQQADKSLTGTVTDDSEQLIVGATNPAFVTRAEWKQVPDRAKSPMVLKPVDSDWDCTKLMDSVDQLFPAVPEVDW